MVTFHSFSDQFVFSSPFLLVWWLFITRGGGSRSGAGAAGVWRQREGRVPVPVFRSLSESVPVPVLLVLFSVSLLSVCFTWIWGRPPQWELLGPTGPVAKIPRSAWSCFGHHIKWSFLDFYSRSLDFYLNMEYMLLRAFSLSSQHFINAILCSSPFSFVEQKTSCFAHHRYQVLFSSCLSTWYTCYSSDCRDHWIKGC